MITKETIDKLAKQYQMSAFPGVVREYFQHVFLEQLYKLPEAERLLFKGGTALRIIYGSPSAATRDRGGEDIRRFA